MDNLKREIMKTKDMVVHEIAYLNPEMTEEQYNVLKNSIAEEGQLNPVLTYRGKIVDGKHRLRALKELNIETIKVEKLPNNLTLEEVKKKVMATEERRHQTPTQLAIKGYRLYKSGDYTQEKAAKKAGCPLTNLKYVIQLERLGRIDLIDKLEKGEKVDISTDPKVVKPSDSLTAIIRKVKHDNYINSEMIKKAMEKAKKDPDDLTKEEAEELDSFATFVKAILNKWEVKMQYKFLFAIGKFVAQQNTLDKDYKKYIEDYSYLFEDNETNTEERNE